MKLVVNYSSFSLFLSQSEILKKDHLYICMWMVMGLEIANNTLHSRWPKNVILQAAGLSAQLLGLLRAGALVPRFSVGSTCLTVSLSKTSARISAFCPVCMAVAGVISLLPSPKMSEGASHQLGLRPRPLCPSSLRGTKLRMQPTLASSRGRGAERSFLCQSRPTPSAKPTGSKVIWIVLWAFKCSLLVRLYF